MDTSSYVRTLARNAEARVKAASALHKKKPTSASLERLSKAVSDWEQALDLWSRVVQAATAVKH